MSCNLPGDPDIDQTLCHGCNSKPSTWTKALSDYDTVRLGHSWQTVFTMRQLAAGTQEKLRDTAEGNADVLWRLQHNSICEHAGERKYFGHLKCVCKGGLLHKTEHNMIYLTMIWGQSSNLVLGNNSVHNVFVRMKNVFDMLAALFPSQYINYIFCFMARLWTLKLCCMFAGLHVPTLWQYLQNILNCLYL